MPGSDSASLAIARQYLGKEVEIIIDRPLGSTHPKQGFVYEANYGFLPGIKAPDGEDLDAYYLGTDQPLSKATGVVCAIVHREDDDDDKLIVMPNDAEMSDDDIKKAILFQEQWFKHVIIRS